MKKTTPSNRPQHLPELKRELRRERCPQAVLDAVQAVAQADASTTERTAFGAWAMVALAVAALAGAFWVWQQSAPPAQPTAPAELVSLRADEVKQAIRQTEYSILLMGKLFRNATDHSQQVVIEASLPALQSGLSNIKQTLNLETNNENQI